MRLTAPTIAVAYLAVFVVGLDEVTQISDGQLQDHAIPDAGAGSPSLGYAPIAPSGLGAGAVAVTPDEDSEYAEEAATAGAAGVSPLDSEIYSAAAQDLGAPGGSQPPSVSTHASTSSGSCGESCTCSKSNLAGEAIAGAPGPVVVNSLPSVESATGSGTSSVPAPFKPGTIVQIDDGQIEIPGSLPGGAGAPGAGTIALGAPSSPIAFEGGTLGRKCATGGAMTACAIAIAFAMI